MSFSRDVKEELSRQLEDARHCTLAELSAILSFGGQIITTPKGSFLKLQTESQAAARKYFTLIRKTFNISIDISVRRNSSAKKNSTYLLILRRPDAVERILQAVKLSFDHPDSMEIGRANDMIARSTCCKRAFIRGAFLIAGSMSNPKKSYHLEIVVNNFDKAEHLQGMIQSFSIDAKIVPRKKNFVVYIKEGSQIVDLLNIMSAHVALMDLENVRILKEVRNQVNRKVNCEAANISKTVIAASKQMEDILYIRDAVGFHQIPEGLEEIAMLRLNNPEASLKELGDMLIPPIGKSGVNHRLRKLSMIAEVFRESKEERDYGNKGDSN